MLSRTTFLLVCLISAKGLAQQGPQPGDIYREYAVNLRTGNNWRVTDSKAGHPGAAEFLPNPTLSIHIDDLDKAIRAEVLMDIWGGHPGTTGKNFLFNNSGWTSIPRVPTLENQSLCYMKQYNVILDLPLEYIHEGENTFSGASGGQVCRSFNWGQWGWYVMMVRIYYQADKAHTAGQISQPLSGDTIMDDPIIKVTAADSGSVSSIQILGNYYGYDENGDGIYKDWHRAYHGVDISGHIGTINEMPFQRTWNTRYTPDQAAGAVSFLARVQDTSGIWFVSDVVENLTLKRPDSLTVRMHNSAGVQENFWVRAGNTKQCVININPPAQATEAILYHRTWNAEDDEAAGGSIKESLLVNGASYKCYGKNHFFALSGVQIAAEDLLPGRNIIAYRSNTEHHGIEILWPGPSVVVRYLTGGDTLPNPIFSPPDGHTFQEAFNASILYETDGRKVYYTTDGTDPNPSDTRYRGQWLSVNKDITFKARAFKTDHHESEVVTASYFLENASGIISHHANITLYPNPAKNALFLDLPPEMGNGNFSIIDPEGRVLATGVAIDNVIPTGQLKNGVYFLKFENSNKIFTAKFVILQ